MIDLMALLITQSNEVSASPRFPSVKNNLLYVSFQNQNQNQNQNPEDKGHFILYNNSGDVYEGNCEDGHPEGAGKIVYSNNITWEGEWRNGRRNGRGRLTFTNSIGYEGEWREDRCVSSDALTVNALPYSNTKQLFQKETGEFSFSTEKQTILCIFINIHIHS